MTFAFHVTLAQWNIGDIIDPGSHGRNWGIYRPNGPMPTPGDIASVMWEIALETARQAIDPGKPSRFDCVFAAETVDAATSFRDSFRPTGSIVTVEFPLTMKVHRGDMAVMDTQQTAAYATYMAPAAIRYWRDKPTGFVELLIGGPVTVVGRP